ncbi:hypothetical protein [Thalassolituus sp.]|uniref:hypothetical protein n=1 Tax=Thalassolituus sp. TaxID=2030822 RepID=UPI003515899D
MDPLIQNEKTRMNTDNKIGFEVAWKALATLIAIIVALLFPIGYFVWQGYIQGLGFNVELVDPGSVDIQIWGFHGFLNISATVVKPLLSSAFIIAIVAGIVGVVVTHKPRHHTLALFRSLLMPLKRQFEKVESKLNKEKRARVIAILEVIQTFGIWAYHALIAVTVLAFIVLLLSVLPKHLTEIGETIAKDQKEQWGAKMCGDLDSSIKNHCVKITHKDNEIVNVGVIIYRSGNEIGLINETGAKHLTLPKSFDAVPYDPNTAKNEVRW